MKDKQAQTGGTEMRRVYSLPADGHLPRRLGRARVYMNDGERTYAYVGWHPTYGEHAKVRAGKIKLTGGENA